MHTIAVIDDNGQAAEAVGYTLEDAGFTPWIFPGTAETAEAAAIKIQENADAAICDHRLSPLGLANFDGAELAAILIEKQIPAVLISQFVSQDYDVSIRRWRAKVPSLICRDEFRAETIKDALELCRREISGEIFPERRKHRTLLRIADIQNEANEQVIDAILPAWNRQRAVRFPLTMVPKKHHHLVQKGQYLIAYVNLGALRPEDLFLEEFEPPLPLDETFA